MAEKANLESKGNFSRISTNFANAKNLFNQLETGNQNKEKEKI